LAWCASMLGRPSDRFVWIVIGCYGLLTLLAFRFAESSWRELIATSCRLAPIAGDRAVLDGLASRANWSLRPGNQVVAATVGLLAGLSAAVIVTLSKDSDSSFAPVYVVAIVWTGLIGSLTLYWIACVPVIFSGLTGIRHPSVEWSSPQLTPGVAATEKLISAGARRASIGLFLFAVPIGLTLLSEPPSPSVLIFSAAGLMISASAIMIAVVLPRLWLSRLLSRGRTALLKELRKSVPDLKGLQSLTVAELPAAALAYQQLIAGTPPKLGLTTLAKMGVQAVFSILPYVAGPLLRAIS
jgi:hypothetical protein